MQLSLFGMSFVGTIESGGPELAPRKVMLLLAALALAAPRPLGRDALCGLFWPDRDEAQARGSLRQALSTLRRAIQSIQPALRLTADPQAVLLAGDTAAVDVWRFDALCAKSDARSLADAATLYAGDILADAIVSDSLAEWLRPAQRAYREKALLLCERLSEMAGSAGDYAIVSCEALAKRLLAVDPCAEEAHRALIRLHLIHGNPNKARRQFEECGDALRREHGVSPEDRTRALLEAVQDGPRDVEPASSPAASFGGRPSIAVLPFRNVSGDTAQDYVVDGMADEIIAALSRVRGLAVIGRNSSFTYRQPDRDVRAIAAQLGVRYVLVGSVRMQDTRIRVVAELVDGSQGFNVWADRLDGRLADIFDLQDSLTEAIVGAILPTIRSNEIDRARRKRPDSLDAYDCVMRAMPAVWSNALDRSREGLDLLDRAMRLDPNYALARSLSAWLHIQQVIYLRSDDPDADRHRAVTLAEQAMVLDQNDPLVLTSLGAAHTLAGDWERAAGLLERALRLDPNSAWAWQRSGWLHVYRGQSNDAIEHFGNGLRISPFDPINFNSFIGIGTAHFAAGRYEDAVMFLRRGLDQQPDADWAHRILCSALAQAGRIEEARASARALLRRYPAYTVAQYRRTFTFSTPFLDRMIEGQLVAGLPRD